MNRKSIFLIDAIINFVLAFLLGIFPKDVINFLGLPVVANPFYASILGGVSETLPSLSSNVVANPCIDVFSISSTKRFIVSAI